MSRARSVRACKADKNSSYLLQKRPRIKVSVVKGRQQTGERCGGVLPAPVCSQSQQSNPSSTRSGGSSRTTAARRSKAEREEGAGLRSACVWSAIRLWDFKDPVPHSDQTVRAESRIGRDRVRLKFWYHYAFWGRNFILSIKCFTVSNV